MNHDNLGEAFLQVLCARKVRVVFSVRSCKDPRSLIPAGCDAHFVEASLGGDEGASEAALVEKALALAGGSIDLLVANHANDTSYAEAGFLAGTSWHRFERGLRSNFVSHTELLRLALKKSNLKGAVFVSSASAGIAEARLLHYMAAKAAMNAFVASFNAEWAEDSEKDFRVTLMHGPMMSTHQNKANYDAADLAKMAYDPVEAAERTIDGAERRVESVEFYPGRFTAILRAITDLYTPLGRWILKHSKVLTKKEKAAAAAKSTSK